MHVEYSFLLPFLPSNTCKMSGSFFNQASQLVIERSNFNSVAGNQYINNNNYNLSDPVYPRLKGNSILSQVSLPFFLLNF